MVGSENSAKRVFAGGLFALFCALVIAALAVFGVISMTLGHIFMMLAALVGALLICTEVIPAKPPKHKVIVTLILWGLLGGADYLIVLNKAEGEASKALTEGKPLTQVPHISAELSVDSTNPKKTAFRVLLENVGPVAITSLRTFVHSDSVSWTILVPNQSTIAPHEKTELASGNPSISKRPKQVEVYLLYESASREDHYSEYSFVVPEIVAGSQPILPTFTKEGNGDPLGADKLVASEGIETFRQDTGTLILFFPDKKPDGSPNQIHIWAKNRSIAVNSVTHKAAVWTGLDKVDKYAEADLVRTANDAFEIGVTWDDSEGKLAIQVGDGPSIQAVPIKRRDAPK